MNINKDVNIDKNSNPPIEKNKVQESSKFLRELNLKKENLPLLNRVKESTSQKISNQTPNTSSPLSEHTASLKESDEESVSIEQVVTNKLEMLPLFKSEIIKENIEDLNDFVLEIPKLFGKDKEFSEGISIDANELKKAYEQIDNTNDLALIQKTENAIVEKREEMRKKIVNWTIKEEKFGTEQASFGLKIIANLLKGLEVKRLLDESFNTHEVFSNVKEAMKKVDINDLGKITDSQQRKEAYRHIKTLKESSASLLSIEKQAKITFEKQSPSKKQLTEAELKFNQMENSFKEIQNLADTYEKALAFVDTERNEFSDLTVESRHPRREHLLMYANDIFQGARQLIVKYKAEEQEKIFNKVAKDDKYDSIEETTIKDLFERSKLKQGLTEKEAENIDLVFLMSSFNNELASLEKKLNQFEYKICELQKNAVEHEDIGNSNPMEFLAKGMEESKKQQEKAKNAINGLFQDLKQAYCDLAGLEDPQAAAKILTEARNDVLSDKMRWSRPIEKNIEFSGRLGKMSVQHKMTCLNSGYPSSAFRGREEGLDCIQPNLHKVEITNSQGKVVSSYTSSATNVEFFQLDKAKREKATLQQTGEILMEKIDSKLGSLSQEELSRVGTKEKPIVVDVLTTLLLSPDTLRDWLLKTREGGLKTNEEKIKNFGNKWLPTSVNQKLQSNLHVDPSLLEKQMLEESLAAWMSFNSDNPNHKNMPNELQFKDKEGNIRTLYREVINGKQLFYTKDPLAPLDLNKRLYVKFEISCYNVGCNKMTKMMENAYRGKSFETIAKKAVGFARILGMTVTKYKGELGNSFENDINAIAFKKDTKRYQIKIGQLTIEKKALQKNLPQNENETIQKIETTVKENLAEARNQLEKIERSPKATPEQKLKAFRNWQQVRSDVGGLIESALNQKGISNEMKDYLMIMHQEGNLRDLYNEIKDQFDLKDYRSQKGMERNMYTLPSNLVAFGIELGANPHTGCRSGKDRTSLQRIEVGTRILSKEVNGRYLNYRELEETPETVGIREQMLLNSGHIDDLAYLNIGSSGLNLSGGYGSYLKYIGSDGTIYTKDYEKNVSLGTKDVFSMKLK